MAIFNRILGLSLALALLSACTAVQGHPKIEPAPGTSAEFGGLLRDLPTTEDSAVKVRYIFHIHGMGLTVREDFHNGLYQPLLDAGYEADPAFSDHWAPAKLPASYIVDGEGLDCTRPWKDSVRGAPTDEVKQPCSYSSFGEYRVDRLKKKGSNDEIRLYTYYWHRDLWRTQEPYLRLDMNDESQRRRSLLTKKLKYDIMDGGLSDASVYDGDMGGLVRMGIRSVLCTMLKDAVPAATRLAAPGPATAPAPSNCLDAAAPEGIDPRTVTFNFVSHSLGSRMLFDALTGDGETVRQGYGLTNNEQLSFRGALLARTHYVYMAANQLPLLATAQVRVSEVNTRTSRSGCQALDEPFFASLCDVPRLASLTENGVAQNAALNKAAPFPSITIVGFHDPDDLLGYRASGGFRKVDERLTFIDVTHRNTPQYLALFALPWDAHDQELNRASSRNLILCGGKAGSDGKLTAFNCAAPSKP